MFSVQFLVISCYLSYRPRLGSVVDSLNCNDKTVHQKLFFLFQKHSKTRLQQCRNIPVREGKGGEGRGGKYTWRSAPPHFKTLDPPLVRSFTCHGSTGGNNRRTLAPTPPNAVRSIILHIDARFVATLTLMADVFWKNN